MLSIIRTSVLALMGLSLPALAMGSAATEVDANGDGILSVAEVQAIYPEVTAEQFAAMDLNADGALDDTEVQAAQEAGLMPAPAEG